MTTQTQQGMTPKQATLLLAAAGLLLKGVDDQNERKARLEKAFDDVAFELAAQGICIMPPLAG
jgi:hypothetical protein